MKHNIVVFDKEAKEKLLTGVETIYKAVSSTLGPKATNVAIDREYGAPTVLQDGVSVAKAFDRLEDKFENMGAQIVKQAAENTNDIVGDGTTTSIVLAHGIFKEAHQNIVAGANPMMIRRGIEAAVEAMTTELTTIAIPVNTPEAVQQVANISAQNALIGELVSNAIQKMGEKGVVAVEEAKGSDQITVEYKEGMQFDKGYHSRYFMTDNETGEAVLDDPYVLVTDKRINNLPEFLGFLEPFVKESNGAPLFIICESLDDQPLVVLVQNKMQGNIKVLAVGVPGFGDQRRSYLEDIAISTGANFISEETGRRLDTVTIEELGRAHRVVASKETTLIVGGNGIEDQIKERVTSIESAIKKAGRDFDRERLQERLAKLTSGVAVINVGASSEAEMREKKERVIDAIAAVRAAQSEGIVPGGETALLRVVHALDSIELTPQEQIGVEIVRQAVTLPYRKLMENSGYDPGEKLAEFRYQAEPKKNYGIDVIDGKVKDLVKAGVIDPVKVTKSALKNAASSAIMLMTTSTLISYDELGTGRETQGA